MKTVLIIGMGRFGHHLASNMISLGNEVMIVDKDESRLEDLTKLISNIKIGDCTNEDVLQSFGVANFDICFVWWVSSLVFLGLRSLIGLIGLSVGLVGLSICIFVC